jgi:hypothetical protein
VPSIDPEVTVPDIVTTMPPARAVPVRSEPTIVPSNFAAAKHGDPVKRNSPVTVLPFWTNVEVVAPETPVTLVHRPFHVPLRLTEDGDVPLLSELVLEPPPQAEARRRREDRRTKRVRMSSSWRQPRSVMTSSDQATPLEAKTTIISA